MKLSDLEALNAARAGGQERVLLTELASGRQAMWPHDAPLDHELEAACRAALRDETPRRVEISGQDWFVHPFVPPRRLVVVGAVHIAQALVRLAAQAGDAPVVVDPRSAFARPDRFPGLRVSTDWPDEFLEAQPLGPRDALVTLTHDPKLDDPALDLALRSPAHYIGALGSKKSHRARLQRLRDRGFDEESLARIHGPVGLPIGSRSPFEIAVSVVAQMIQVRRA